MKSEKRIVQFVPNALTLLRVGLTVIFLAILFAAGRSEAEKPAALLMVGFVVFVVAGLTDIVDGKIARHYDVTSKFGRLVDPLADKALVCGAFLVFGLAQRPLLANFGWSETTLHVIRWGMLAILTLRETAVTFIRHLAESRGVAFGAVWSGKFKMLVQSFGIGTVIIGWAFVSRPWGDWFTIITYGIVAAITILSGIHSFTRRIR
ncbi:MAG TPA: CDP-alcohol phosphatidyltransferase family protein [Anaerohalosphaeraceae bacterium]|jgi:CDP-diacylglycerol--glycerol-3-phosphate 3-phosphatidyltransferase|nr:CDP-alcohol phosphatidyltransferase family protein [Anaerohalosphaeraceae bacterium]HRT50504.1 CDP-alcohol phosphatidyltransferase family protein [Anaerohalosphaeraceae bacterium]HRT86434.1 CDP-alcohol phosphatidyltransferase family protein [Anaerohalosphaeraceae bacterium]